jgi:hypothetical protein
MKEETLCAERNVSSPFDLILIRKTLGRMKNFYDICLFHASLSLLFSPSAMAFLVILSCEGKISYKRREIFPQSSVEEPERLWRSEKSDLLWDGPVIGTSVASATQISDFSNDLGMCVGSGARFGVKKPWKLWEVWWKLSKVPRKACFLIFFLESSL